MRKKGEQTLRDALRNDGWSNEDIDTVMEDVEEVEQLMEEDDCFFDQFMEAGVEDLPNA